MAEAYLKSKNLPNVEVTSSGIEAKKDLNGWVSKYTINLLEESNIFSYLSQHWIQSTKEIIESQDLVIFMRQNHYDYCIDKLKCNLGEFHVWDVLDLGDYFDNKLEKIPLEIKQIKAKEIFEEIKKGVDSLIVDL